MSLPTALFLVPAGVCGLSWFGIGHLVPRRALPDDVLLRVLTRTAAGATALAVTSYGLGRVHLYSRPLLIVITAVFAAAAVPSLRKLRHLSLCLDSTADRLLAAAIGVAITVDLVSASVPPTSADALKYHLALPKLWLQTGGIGDAFWDWTTFNPFGIEMLYGQGLALGGGPTASALGGMIAALAGLAIYGLGRALGQGRRRAGLVAAALFVFQGIFTWDATSVFVELGLTFFLTLSVWYGVRFVRSQRRLDLLWAGALAGSTAGTKYVGLQAWLLMVPLLALGLERRRLRSAAGALGLALLTGGIWYLKNALVAQNPVYPLLGHGKWWTPESQHGVDVIRRLYGVGGSALRLAILPIDLLIHGGAFDRGQYVGTAIFVAGLLTFVLARNRETVVLTASAILFLLSWWYLSPQARFLLPALAVLSAVGGAGVVALAGRSRAGAALAAVGALAIGVGWAAPTFALTRRSLPVAVGGQSRRSYLEAQTGTYRVLVDASRRSSGVLALAGYPFVFNVPRQAISLGEPEFAVDVPTDAFRRRLRLEGIRFILSANRSVRAYPQLRGCLTSVARYEARFVTSRSLGTSVPIAFRLYRLHPLCMPA
jgi:hypothetical protein